jgi:guanosine-3',5'-bis(diphosphate) 3'-pyrophosphohydrolase
MRNDELVRAARVFAAEKHHGQKRKYTGEPYVNHAVAVANIVHGVGGSPEMVIAALLHDTLEDTTTTITELKSRFGGRVAKLVVELSDVYVHGNGHGNRAERKRKERERLAQVSADAQTIKVADLIDNTASIVARDPDFAKVYLAEKAALLAVLTKAHPALLQRAMEQLK